MSAGSSEELAKSEPSGEDTPATHESRPDVKVKTEPSSEAERLEDKPKVTTASGSTKDDPPGLSRSLTTVNLVDKGKSVAWSDVNNNTEAQEARVKGEPSKRPDLKPPNFSVSVTVSRSEGACEGQFSDAESEEIEHGTQMSSSMLMSSSVSAESTVHGSSWDR